MIKKPWVQCSLGTIFVWIYFALSHQLLTDLSDFFIEKNPLPLPLALGVFYTVENPWHSPSWCCHWCCWLVHFCLMYVQHGKGGGGGSSLKEPTQPNVYFPKFKACVRCPTLGPKLAWFTPLILGTMIKTSNKFLRLDSGSEDEAAALDINLENLYKVILYFITVPQIGRVNPAKDVFQLLVHQLFRWNVFSRPDFCFQSALLRGCGGGGGVTFTIGDKTYKCCHVCTNVSFIINCKKFRLCL